MAVLAPMPSMRVRVTVSAKPGWRRSERIAWPKSLRRSPQTGRRNSSRLVLPVLARAELELGPAARLLGRHAEPDVPLGLHVDVKTDLFVEPSLPVVAWHLSPRPAGV